MDNREILTKARELITPRSAWAREAYARDENGIEVDPHDPRATCFCMIGAILKVTGLSTDEVNHTSFTLLELATGWSETPEFNDNGGTTHDEVLRAFDRAINLA